MRRPPVSDAELRKALLWFIGAFANWDMASHPTYLRVGRYLVQAAHEDLNRRVTRAACRWRPAFRIPAVAYDLSGGRNWPDVRENPWHRAEQ